MGKRQGQAEDERQESSQSSCMNRSRLIGSAARKESLQGAAIGLMLEGALLATWRAGALGLVAAAAAVGVVEGCQKSVPAVNVTLSF